MVLAEGIEMNILFQHHVVVVHVEALLQVGRRRIGIAAGKLLIHPRDAVGGLQQTLTVDILADPAED